MSNERPTIKDIYEVVDRLERKVEDNFATKTEMRLTVALGLVGGSAVASLIASYMTRMTPSQQAVALVHLIF